MDRVEGGRPDQRWRKKIPSKKKKETRMERKEQAWKLGVGWHPDSKEIEILLTEQSSGQKREASSGLCPTGDELLARA